MYGIDWGAPFGKKRGPKKGAKQRRRRKTKVVQPIVKKIRAAGDKMVKVRDPVKRDKGEAIREHYRIYSPKTLSQPSPEGQDYHVNAGEGRIMPHFNKWDRGWNEW